MVTQDAETFVALGRAVSLAAAEGALEPAAAADLSAALVAGILSGCMDLDTYARVHDALARLLERAFELGPAPAPRSGPGSGPSAGAAAAEPLDVYLEVVGEAWGKVAWDEEACSRLKGFVEQCFDVARGEFDSHDWYRAPLGCSPAALQGAARAAGLLVISCQGSVPRGELVATLRDAGAAPGAAGLVLGWGERRVALELSPAGR
ncbi:MAG: hypothetical protein ACYDA8_08010 [Deferrisomatales bacterium]